MPCFHRRLALTAGLLLVLGCNNQPHYVENPTGSCEPNDNGARPGHSPGDSQYLPDCEPALAREYYRVFAKEDQTAYMIPRPDGAGLRYGYCDGEDPELSELFDRNGLCVEIADTQTVDTINAMPPEDALRIAHLLHEQLVFVAEGESDSWRIEPGVFSNDVVDACNRAAVDLGDAQEACNYHRKRASGGNQDDMDHSYTRAECEQLAPALNELYGVDPS